MAGGNKKKKTKPVANPARGFATTSLISKKATTDAGHNESNSTDVSGVATPETVPTSIASGDTAAAKEASPGRRELHELSPEELESQLEESELQQFVEQHAPRVRKESGRQVSRLQTDKRVLRGQADYLSVKDWLPDELMQQLLDIKTVDSSEDHSPLARKHGHPLGDDLLSKVWALRLCLLALDIPPHKVNEVLSWAVSRSPSFEDAGHMWGLSESLERLSLNCDTSELFDYDFQKPKAEIDQPDEPIAAEQEPKSKKKDSPVSEDKGAASIDGEDDGLDISDVDSDLEPDELLVTYLRTRARLYDINPVMEGAMGRKKAGKGSQNANSGVTVQGSREKKLLQKLQQIQSDVLFDQQQADAQWDTKKIELAREAADRRKLQLSDAEPSRGGSAPAPSETTKLNGVSDEAEQLGQDLLAEAEDADDADMLSGMFSALPGVQDTSIDRSAGGTQPSNVAIRDFGRLTGMNPKRVLEEACKSRDSRVKVVYRMVSPTTYASRHSLTISWSKEQETVEASYLPEVEVKSKPRNLAITALHEATPDAAQSEAYIATIALFAVFSGSPKEEKAHLKLPPAFRNLWDELLQKKQDHGHAADRETVRELRKLVERNIPSDDDDADEVVFNATSRQRSAAPSGTTTPMSQSEVARSRKPEFSQQLQDMWRWKVSAPSYQNMLQGRMNLPMFQFRGVALEAIERHQIVIVRGETGSGKSTQLPAFILEHELSQGRHCKIYCTEPRRISAISLANRVSEEMGERKGDVGTPRSLVGYAIRLESQTSAQTRLVSKLNLLRCEQITASKITATIHLHGVDVNAASREGELDRAHFPEVSVQPANRKLPGVRHDRNRLTHAGERRRTW